MQNRVKITESDLKSMIKSIIREEMSLGGSSRSLLIYPNDNNPEYVEALLDKLQGKYYDEWEEEYDDANEEDCYRISGIFEDSDEMEDEKGQLHVGKPYSLISKIKKKFKSMGCEVVED